jgi:L-lactate permease
MWNQVYNPLSHPALSTIAAAIPVVTLLVLIASNRVKAHVAAVIALIAANLVAILVFTMPANMSIRASILGAITGFFPIGWIVLNVIFLYRLTLEKGAFETLQTTIGGLTNDRRLQLLLIAFSFGAFFEGASGFGTPVAVTGAMLIGLGFSPLAASGLSLIANTAPVAYGALGTPIAGLSSVTGIDPFLLGAMVGRQLPFFSLIVPFLADLGLRGVPGHARGVAGRACHRRLLRNPAVLDLQLHQSVDCRHWRVADFHGLPDPVPEGVAAEGAVDIPRVADPRRFGRNVGCAAEPSWLTPQQEASLAGSAAVDHRLHHIAALGYELVQGAGQSRGDLELSRSRA